MNAILQQYGLTRGKLAVILGLCALLVGVWGNALLGGGSSRNSKRVVKRQTNSQAASKVERRTPSQARAPLSKSAPGKSSVALQDRTPLPPVEVSQVARTDPFARPRWAEDKTVAARRSSAPSLTEREALLQQLREQGVSMVMLSGDKKIAQIGDRRVRTGDTLSGFRIIDITTAGVVLSDQPVSDGL